jgi:hypothetical protein
LPILPEKALEIRRERGHALVFDGSDSATKRRRMVVAAGHDAVEGQITTTRGPRMLFEAFWTWIALETFGIILAFLAPPSR